jgi:hypothetical protein
MLALAEEFKVELGDDMLTRTVDGEDSVKIH